MRAIIEPRRSNCNISGVLMLLSNWDARKTLPCSVLSPTAVTCIMAWPSMTLVPFITTLDGNVASGSNSDGSIVLAHKGSPVSVDSSTCSEAASTNSPSAGTSSPVLRMTMSPTTTSRRGMLMVSPLRTTCTGSSSLTVLSRANSFSARISKKKASEVAHITAMNMPKGSKKVPLSCPSQKYSYKDMSSDNTPATIRMAMSGSLNLAKKSFQRDLRATGVSTLVPCSWRLTSTCADVNPAFLSVVSIILIVYFGLIA